jgi:hypothetical protein
LEAVGLFRPMARLADKDSTCGKARRRNTASGLKKRLISRL